MASSDPQILHACKPASVQPGGGWCVKVELAWGRLRRAWLRRLRPAYVRMMAERRQGNCPDCPHDIIDSRDLKYWRNVCGYWFHPEHDPFAWRSRMGFARAGLAELCVATEVLWIIGLLFGLATVIHWLFWIPVASVALIWLEILYFFRDPERRIPTDPAALLSPADGTVTDIGEVEAPGFPGDRAWRIGIFLSIFNVHVNRIPRTGRVVS